MSSLVAQQFVSRSRSFSAAAEICSIGTGITFVFQGFGTCWSGTTSFTWRPERR